MEMFVPPPVKASHRRVQQLADQHDSIASLALAVFEEAELEKQAAEAERVATQTKLRNQFVASWHAKYAPLATAAFAEKIGLSAGHPLIAGIEWTVNLAEWAGMSFTEKDGYIQAHESGKGQQSLWTDFDGFKMSVSIYGSTADKAPMFTFVGHRNENHTFGITSLEEIGEAIMDRIDADAEQEVGGTS